jgi:hypothetical protein
MNTPFEIIAAVTALAMAPGLMVLLNERRLRRLAEARLGLAKAATLAEKMMLSGETTVGCICHDHLCKTILFARHEKKFDVSWNPFMSRKEMNLHRQLDTELESSLRAGELMSQFIFNFAKAFRNCHPIKFLLFSAWIAFAFGGIRMLVIAFKAALFGGKGIISLSQAWRQQKRAIAEWSVKLGLNQNDGQPVGVA